MVGLVTELGAPLLPLALRWHLDVCLHPGRRWRSAAVLGGKLGLQLSHPSADPLVLGEVGLPLLTRKNNAVRELPVTHA